jgi:O-antigen/teichoic acid export membrane protein
MNAENQPESIKTFILKIFSTAAIYSSGNIIQGILLLILIPIYTHYLTPEDFGFIALMVITISLITSLVIYPIDRFYFKPGNIERKGLILFNLFFFMASKTLLFAILYWVLGDFIFQFLSNDPQFKKAFQLYVGILILSPPSYFIYNFLRLTGMTKRHVYLTVSKAFLSFALSIFLLAEMDWGVLAVVYGEIAGISIVVLFGMPVLFKHFEYKVSSSIIVEPIKYSYPLIPAEHALLLIKSGDRYVLNLLGSVHLVGIYSFGTQISEIINALILHPLRDTLIPLILKQENNPEENKAFIEKVCGYYYVVAIFVALGMALFSKELVMLLASREEFWESWVIVPIVGFSFVQHGLGMFLGMGLIFANKSIHSSLIVVFSAGINIFLNFILIPHWGLMGAAVATLCSYFTWNGLKAYYSAKFYNLTFNWQRIFNITLVGVCLYFLSWNLGSAHISMFTLTIKLSILSSYFPILYITKILSSEEVKVLKTGWKYFKAMFNTVQPSQ